MRRGLLLFGSLLLMTAPIVAAEPSACKDVEPYFKIAGATMVGPESNGAQAFAMYRQVASSAAGAAKLELGARIAGLRDGVPVAAADKTLASCMLRSFLLARYGERMGK